jgi:glycine/D-amino acid oxidase-like deaminating enzyme/nitrite reductase/ring-hydroxylating ferredoxin subunit
LANRLLGAQSKETRAMTPHHDTTPYWQDTPMPRFARIERNERADVVVVGGGITGLTAAYLLAGAGKSVTLLERERCAQIDTGHTSAHLTMVVDESLTDLVAHFGRDHAQAVWDAGLAAVAQIDAIVRAEEIVCGFDWVPGYLHGPLGAPGDSRDAFVEEAKLAADLGFDASFVDQVPFVGGPGVRFDGQARLHPRKYLSALARAAESRGVRIHEHSPAEEFTDTPMTVKANGCTIACDYVVLATHTPLMGHASLASATLFQTKLALYTSYVVGGRAEKGRIDDALFWDTADPYHFLRLEPHRDHDFVIFGGEDHKTGQAADTEACYDRLSRTLGALVPGIAITHRWSGQVIDTPDGLPYIGETAERQFAATGFSGNGLTFGTLGGMMACDRLLERENPWTDLFDTGRKKIRGGLWDYVRENKDYPYYLVRDRFAGAAGRSLRALRRGEGKVIELDGEKVAAFRDESGAAIVRSAVCTHMGCLVQWNAAERTWDCPCHGSRFKPNGDVIAGPAETPLKPPSGSA